jgi:MFS transporter, DHA1 family, multidrug resistance protein
MSLGRIIGPIWAGFALDIYLQLPFYTGAAVFVVAFVASLIWLNAGAPRPRPA